MTKKKTYENVKFYASANTKDGFYSLFGKIFQPELFSRIYILKGGSGTGKSTLMRTIGHKAELRGEEVEYYACSSDPDSLDGIILTEKGIAVIDGTLPHSVEPTYPGIIEEIVYTGNFWNVGTLERERENLVNLIKEKNINYKRGYAFLSCVGTIEEEERKLIINSFLQEKAFRVFTRMFGKIKEGEKYQVREKFLEGISKNGIVRLNTLSNICEINYGLLGEKCVAQELLKIILGIFKSKKQTVLIGRDYINPNHTLSLYNENLALSIEIIADKNNYMGKVINCDRFINAEELKKQRQKLKFLKKCKQKMISAAIDSFKEAGEKHEEIEAIYKDAMDFDALNKYSEDFTKLII